MLGGVRERRERYIRNAAFFPFGSLTPRSPFATFAISFSHSFCYAVVAAHFSPSRYSCQLPPLPSSPSLPSSLPSAFRSRYSTFIRSANLPDKPMPLLPSPSVFQRSLSLALFPPVLQAVTPYSPTILLAEESVLGL